MKQWYIHMAKTSNGDMTQWSGLMLCHAISHICRASLHLLHPRLRVSQIGSITAQVQPGRVPNETGRTRRSTYSGFASIQEDGYLTRYQIRSIYRIQSHPRRKLHHISYISEYWRLLLAESPMSQASTIKEGLSTRRGTMGGCQT
jgi:hypothetical protein